MRERAASVLVMPAVDMDVRGIVARDETVYAEDAVASRIGGVDKPIREPRLRITRYRQPAPLAVVQVNVAVADRLVRAQAAAARVTEATDLAVERLRQRLDLLLRHLAAEDAGQVPFAVERWPQTRSSRPAGQRAAVRVGARVLVRSKAFPIAVQTPDAAVLAMELRDYDFHLFAEDRSGTESVVYRGGQTGGGLLRLAATPHTAGVVPLSVRPQPAPWLGIPEAIKRLNEKPAQRFLFFADSRTGRGRVLYQRYDGHLGLMAPAW